MILPNVLITYNYMSKHIIILLYNFSLDFCITLKIKNCFSNKLHRSFFIDGN